MFDNFIIADTTVWKSEPDGYNCSMIDSRHFYSSQVPGALKPKMWITSVYLRVTRPVLFMRLVNIGIREPLCITCQRSHIFWDIKLPSDQLKKKHILILSLWNSQKNCFLHTQPRFFLILSPLSSSYTQFVNTRKSKQKSQSTTFNRLKKSSVYLFV